MHVIHAFRIRFPHVDFGVRDRGAVSVFHGTYAQKRFAARVVGKRLSCLYRRRFVRVVGAENGAFGGGSGFGVVDGVYEERETDYV